MWIKIAKSHFSDQSRQKENGKNASGEQPKQYQVAFIFMAWSLTKLQSYLFEVPFEKLDFSLLVWVKNLFMWRVRPAFRFALIRRKRRMPSHAFGFRLDLKEPRFVIYRHGIGWEQTRGPGPWVWPKSQIIMVLCQDRHCTKSHP